MLPLFSGITSGLLARPDFEGHIFKDISKDMKRKRLTCLFIMHYIQISHPLQLRASSEAVRVAEDEPQYIQELFGWRSGLEEAWEEHFQLVDTRFHPPRRKFEFAHFPE